MQELELHVDDLVMVQSADGFNGARGRITHIMHVDTPDWGWSYMVDIVRQYGRMVVPFRRDELTLQEQAL